MNEVKLFIKQNNNLNTKETNNKNQKYNATHLLKQEQKDSVSFQGNQKKHHAPIKAGLIGLALAKILSLGVCAPNNQNVQALAEGQITTPNAIVETIDEKDTDVQTEPEKLVATKQNPDGSITEITKIVHNIDGLSLESSSDPIVKKTTYPNGKIVEKTYSEDGTHENIKKVTIGNTVTTTTTSGATYTGTGYKKVTKEVAGKLVKESYETTSMFVSSEDQINSKKGYKIICKKNGDVEKTEYEGGLFKEYDAEAGEYTGKNVNKNNVKTYINNKLTKEEKFVDDRLTEETKYDKDGKPVQKNEYGKPSKSGEVTVKSSNIEYLKNGNVKTTTYTRHEFPNGTSWETDDEPIVQKIESPNGSSSEVHYVTSPSDPFYSKKVKIDGSTKTTIVKENESERHTGMGYGGGAVSEKITVEKDGKLVKETYKYKNENCCTTNSRESAYTITVDEEGNEIKDEYVIYKNVGEVSGDDGDLTIITRTDTKYVNGELKDTKTVVKQYTEDGRLIKTETRGNEEVRNDDIQYDEQGRVILSKEKSIDENGVDVVLVSNYTYKDDGTVIQNITRTYEGDIVPENCGEYTEVITTYPDGKVVALKEYESFDGGTTYAEETTTIGNVTTVKTSRPASATDIVETYVDGKITEERGYYKTEGSCVTVETGGGYIHKFDENGNKTECIFFDEKGDILARYDFDENGQLIDDSKTTPSGKIDEIKYGENN